MQVDSFLSVTPNSFESFEGEAQIDSWISTIVDMYWKETFFIEYKIVWKNKKLHEIFLQVLGIP
jgi:hypothetical protein